MDIFSNTELKKCDYCGLPPKPKEGKEHLFNGFRDIKTGHLVCWTCKKGHNQRKNGLKC